MMGAEGGGGGVEIGNSIRQRVRGGTTAEVQGDEETGVWEMSEGPVHLQKGVRNEVGGWAEWD